MESQLFHYDDWANSNVIYTGTGYILNPYYNEDVSTLTIDDFECIKSDCVNFECREFQRIQKIQKATHNNHYVKIFDALTFAFSGEYNKSIKKYYFIKDEFSRLEEMLSKFQDDDIPVIEMYQIKIFGIELTGCQVHKIRCLLKHRLHNGDLTYDHIYPSHGPLARFNENNICVLADAIGNFLFWLRDLNKLFDRNHFAICKAAHFNPNNPGLDDYLNFVEAYYTDNLFSTIQSAFEETCRFRNLKLEVTNCNEFHIDYISNKFRKLTSCIDITFRSTEPVKRSFFITPVYLKLKQISNKAYKRFHTRKDKFGFETAFNTDYSVYKLLQCMISDLEEFYFDSIKKRPVTLSTSSQDDFKKATINYSLMYKNWNREGSAINALYQAMKEGGEIHNLTDYEDFKNAFSNKAVKNKIGLHFTKGWAFYFFRQLKDTGKIEDCNLWIEVSKSFFLLSNKSYDMTNLAHQKTPRNKVQMNRINTLINSI